MIVENKFRRGKKLHKEESKMQMEEERQREKER